DRDSSRLKGCEMKTHKNPRMSLSKLAEYMVASAGRRRTLLRDQKYPPAFKAARFTEAFSAITDMILHGMDPIVLRRYVTDWRRRSPTSPFEQQQLKLWVEALEAFGRLIVD